MAHRARKRFGQNFLVDTFAISQVLGAIDATGDEHVVEIGPGQGALTDWLVKKAKKLTLIEIDRDLVDILMKRYAHEKHVEIISADALKTDFSTIGRSLRVVGNLPYNISTPLLFHLSQYAEHIVDMHFMLQREVVQRIVAPPGSKTFGRLSVMLQSQFETESLFDIGPEAFDPAPKVWSAIVKMKPLEDRPDIHSSKKFSELVTQAFSQRRKTLRNSLKNLMSAEQISAAGVDPGARPETLSVAAFAVLSNTIAIE